MGKKVLHPSVEEFKQFVKQNPKIIQEVRKQKITWQELYEDWYLLGEDDPHWQKYRSTGKEAEHTQEQEQLKEDTTESKSDIVGQIIGAVKKMDINQIEGHIYNLSQAIGAIQALLSQFQGGNPSGPPPSNEAPKNPFTFRKD